MVWWRNNKLPINYYFTSAASGDICKQGMIKAGVEGVVTGSLKARTYNSSNCTLDLTDVPKHTLVEIKVKKYIQPENCVCNLVDSPNCSQISIMTAANAVSFCNAAPDPFYLYQNSSGNITIVLSGIDSTNSYKLSFTYRGRFLVNMQYLCLQFSRFFQAEFF